MLGPGDDIVKFNQLGKDSHKKWHVYNKETRKTNTEKGYETIFTDDEKSYRKLEECVEKFNKNNFDDQSNGITTQKLLDALSKKNESTGQPLYDTNPSDGFDKDEINAALKQLKEGDNSVFNKLKDNKNNNTNQSYTNDEPDFNKKSGLMMVRSRKEPDTRGGEGSHAGSGSTLTPSDIINQGNQKRIHGERKEEKKNAKIQKENFKTHRKDNDKKGKEAIEKYGLPKDKQPKEGPAADEIKNDTKVTNNEVKVEDKKTVEVKGKDIKKVEENKEIKKVEENKKLMDESKVKVVKEIKNETFAGPTELFDPKSADLSEEGKNNVNKLIKENLIPALKKTNGTNKKIKVIIKGFTDSDPGKYEEYNTELSKQRAEAVSELIKTKIKAPTKLIIVAEGKGTSLPVLDANRKEDKIKSRRVEISIVEVE